MVKQENDPNVGNSLLRTATTKRLGQSKLALNAVRSGAKPPLRRIKVDKEKNSSGDTRYSDLTGSVAESHGGPAIIKEITERDLESVALNSSNTMTSSGSGSHKALGSAVKTNIQPKAFKAFTLPTYTPKTVKKTNMNIHKGISISAPSPMTLDRVQVQMSQEHAVPESKEYKEHQEVIQKMQQEENDKNELKEKKMQLKNTLKEKVVQERGQGFEAELGDFQLGDFSVGDLHAKNDDERPQSTRNASQPKEKKKSLVKKLLGKIKPRSPRKKMAGSVQDESKARAEKALSVVEARSMARKALMASKNKKNGAVEAAAAPPLFPPEIRVNKDASTVSDLDASGRRPFPVAEIRTADQARDDDGSVSTLGTPHVFESLHQNPRHGIEVPGKTIPDDYQERTEPNPSVRDPSTAQLNTASPAVDQTGPIQDQDQGTGTTPSRALDRDDKPLVDQVDSKGIKTEVADNATHISGESGAIEVVADRGYTSASGVQNRKFVTREGVPIDYALAAATCGTPHIVQKVATPGATSSSNEKDINVDDMENVIDEETLAHLEKLADTQEAGQPSEPAAEEEQADESSAIREDSIIVYEPPVSQAPLSPISSFAFSIEAAIRKAQAQRNGESAADEGNAVEEEGFTVSSEAGTASHGSGKSDVVASEEVTGENSEKIDPAADLPNSLSPIDEGEEIVSPPLSPRSGTSRRSGKPEPQGSRYQVSPFLSRTGSSLQSDKNVDDYLKVEESVPSSSYNTDGSDGKDKAQLQSTPKKTGGFLSSLGGMFWKTQKEPSNDPQGERVIDLTKTNTKSNDHGAVTGMWSSADESLQSKSQESRSMGSKEDGSTAKHTEYTGESLQSRSTKSQTETNRIQLGNSKEKAPADSKSAFRFDDFCDIAENKLSRPAHGRWIPRDSSDHDDDRYATEGDASPRHVVVGEDVDEGSVASGQILVVQGVEIPVKSKTPSATAPTPKARGAGQKKSFEVIDTTSTTSGNQGSTVMRSTSFLQSKALGDEQEETQLPDRTPGDESLHGDSEGEIIVISDSFEESMGSKLMSRKIHKITYPQPRRSLVKDLPSDTSFDVYEDPDGEEVVCYEVNPFGLMERSPTTSPRMAGTAARAVRSQEFQEAPQNSILFDSTYSTSRGAPTTSPRTVGTAEAADTSVDSFPPSRRVPSIKSKPTPGDMKEGLRGKGARRSIGDSIGSVQSLKSQDNSGDRSNKSSVRQAASPTGQTKGSNSFAGYFTDGLFDLLSIDSQSVANKGGGSRKQKSSDPDDIPFSQSLGSPCQVDIDDNASTALSAGGPENVRTRHSSEKKKGLSRSLNEDRGPDVFDYVFEYSELMLCGHDPEIVGKHLSKQKQGGPADDSTQTASSAAPFPDAVSVLEKERGEEMILEDDSAGVSTQAKTIPGQRPDPSLGLLCGAVPVYLLYKMNGGDGGPETAEQQVKSSSRRDTAAVISSPQNNGIPVTKTLLQPPKTKLENEVDELSLNEKTLIENSPKKQPRLPSQKPVAGASVASNLTHLSQGIKSPQSATRRAPPIPENLSKHDRSVMSKHDPYWDTLSTIASTKERSTDNDKMRQTSAATPGPIPVEITMTNKSKEGSVSCASVKRSVDSAKDDSKQVVQSMGKLNTLIGDDLSDSSLSYSLTTSDVHLSKSRGCKDQRAEDNSVSEPKHIASSSKTPPPQDLQTGNQDSRRLSRFGSASGNKSIDGPPSHVSSVHQTTDNMKSSDSASKNSRVTSLIARFEAARDEMGEEEMSSARQNSLPNEGKPSDDISRNESDFSEDNSALLLTVTRSEAEEPSVEGAQEGQIDSGNGKNGKRLPWGNLFQRKKHETGGPEKSDRDATIIVPPSSGPQMSESPSEKPEVAPITLQALASQHGDILPTRAESSDEDVHDAPEDAAVIERRVTNSPEDSHTRTALAMALGVGETDPAQNTDSESVEEALDNSGFGQNGNEAPPVQYMRVAMAVGAGSVADGVAATATNPFRDGGASQPNGVMSHRSVSWGFEEVYDPPQLRSSPAPSLQDRNGVPENSRYHNEEDVGPSESSDSPSPFRTDGHGDPRSNVPGVQSFHSTGVSQRTVSWGFEETYDEPLHHRGMPSQEGFEQERFEQEGFEQEGFEQEGLAQEGLAQEYPGALNGTPMAASWTDRNNSSDSGSQHVENVQTQRSQSPASQKGAHAHVAGNWTQRNNNSDHGSRGGSPHLSTARSQSPSSQKSTSNTAAVGPSWAQRNNSSDSGSQVGGSPHMPTAPSQISASQKSSMPNLLPVGPSWAQRNDSPGSGSRGGGSPHLPITRSQSPASQKSLMANTASWIKRNNSSGSGTRGGANLPSTRSQSPASYKSSTASTGAPLLHNRNSSESHRSTSQQGCEHTYTQWTSHAQNSHEGACESEGAMTTSSYPSSVEKRGVTAAIAVAAAAAAVTSSWKTSENNGKSHYQSSTDSRKVVDEFSLHSDSTYSIGKPLEPHQHVQNIDPDEESQDDTYDEDEQSAAIAVAATSAVSSNWKTSENDDKSHTQSSTDSRKVGDEFSSRSDSTYSIGEPLEPHQHVQDIEPKEESQEDTYDEQALIARTLELSKALLASMDVDDLDPEDDMVKSLFSPTTDKETRLSFKQAAAVPHSVAFDSSKKSNTDSMEELVQLTAANFVQVPAESRGLSPEEDTSLQLTTTPQSIEGLVASGVSRDRGVTTNSYARASSTSLHAPVSLDLQKGSRSQTEKSGQADPTGTISRQLSDLQAVEAILGSVAGEDPVIAVRTWTGNTSIQSSESTSQAYQTGSENIHSSASGSENIQSNGSASDVGVAPPSSLPQIPISVSFQNSIQENGVKKYPRQEVSKVDRVVQGRDSGSTVRDSEDTSRPSYSVSDVSRVSDVSHDSPMDANTLLSQYENLAHHLIAQNGQLKIAASSGSSPEQANEGGSTNTSEVVDKLNELRAGRAQALARYQSTQVSRFSTSTPQNGSQQQNDSSKAPGSQSQAKNPALTYSSAQYGKRERDHVLHYSRDSASFERTSGQRAQSTSKARLTSQFLPSEARGRSKSADPVRPDAPSSSYERKEYDQRDIDAMSSSSDSTRTTPSTKARDLRKQLDEALQASREIRKSHENLGTELSTFMSRFQEKNNEIELNAVQAMEQAQHK
jgi:hypothetical protein